MTKRVSSRKVTESVSLLPNNNPDILTGYQNSEGYRDWLSTVIYLSAASVKKQPNLYRNDEIVQ